MCKCSKKVKNKMINGNEQVTFNVSKSFFLTLILFSIILFQPIISAFETELTDTDKDGTPDEFDSDDDGDGYDDVVEYNAGTDPLNNSEHPGNMPLDTDGDLIPDSIDLDDDNDLLADVKEELLNTNPKHVDTDEDNLFDFKEKKLGTNPLKKDSDDDGFSDWDEIFANTNPVNSSNFPKGVIANAGEDQIVHPNGSVILNGIFSVGRITSYSWDFDSSNGIQADSDKEKVKHFYSREGIYTVTLTVSDGKASDTDTCLIIVDQNLSASLNIVKNRQRDQLNYNKVINLNLKSRDNDSVTIEIKGTIKKGIIVTFTIDSYTLIVSENDELVLKFDGLVIDQSSIIGIIENRGNIPLYNISYLCYSLQIILFIPNITTNNLVIEKISEIEEIPVESEPGVIFWTSSSFIFIVIIILFSISFIMGYSYKKTKDQKFYRNLKIDDDIEIRFLDNIKSRNINWEEYDSEK